jgi:hypothetical protein
MKRESGIKDRDDRSRGIEILMTDAFAKIKPTDPFKLAKKQREGIGTDPIPPVLVKAGVDVSQ